MTTEVTNTIIVTSTTSDRVLDNVNNLKEWLMDNVLSEKQITADNPIQLIVLRNFQRVMIISPTRQISQDIKSLLQRKPLSARLCFNYSLTDTKDSIDYLTVPKSEKMFLISPPTSPPPGFDYSRCEQPPPSHTNTRLLEAPIGPDNSDSDELLTLLDSKIANITVQRCPDHPSSTPIGPYQRTALPPQSTFSDIEDEP